jgi:uncharacterized protein (TIGR02217 family)
VAFFEALFPAVPSIGYTMQPDYDVTIVQMQSGREKRNSNSALPRHRYTVTIGPRLREIAQEIRKLWHVVGGRADGFLFKDWSDYLSCDVGVTPSELDQPFEAAGGGTYQLVKDYVFGARTRRRYITKPLAASITVANEFGAVQAPSTYALDATTGILTPNGGFTGTPTSWGGPFYVPVRFDSDLPTVMELALVESVQLTLLELHREDA